MTSRIMYTQTLSSRTVYTELCRLQILTLKKDFENVLVDLKEDSRNMTMESIGNVVVSLDPHEWKRSLGPIVMEFLSGSMREDAMTKTNGNSMR